jgi:hypothetical protein
MNSDGGSFGIMYSNPSGRFPDSPIVGSTALKRAKNSASLLSRYASLKFWMKVRSEVIIP